MTDQEPDVRFAIQVPPEHEDGAYANFMSVWHTPYEFTLDFAATLPPQAADPEHEGSPVVVPCRVTARVKIPVTVIFAVLRALNEKMTNYESKFGRIVAPEAREEEEGG